MTTVLILAGGASTRMNGVNKQLALIDGLPVIVKSALAFERSSAVSRIVIAARDGDLEQIKALCEKHGVKKLYALTPGGASRSESAKRALLAAEPLSDDDIIAIHDGARPYVSGELIERVISAAREYGAAVPAVPVKDTIKSIKDGFCAGTPDRSALRAVQTPQAFIVKICKAMQSECSEAVTDDAMLAEKAGFPVRIVEGENGNIKITTPEDLPRGKTEAKMSDLRIGHGYDVHRLAENRRLVLGGVEIAYEKGLLGHSDADVLIHAIMDALLGALALGDIGKLFPDSDESFKDADSMRLLEQVVELIDKKGYKVSNLDATINAEKPKLSPYIAKMRENIAAVCKTDVSDISVKATTEEGLGLRGEGIGATCVCLLTKK